MLVSFRHVGLNTKHVVLAFIVRLCLKFSFVSQALHHYKLPPSCPDGKCGYVWECQVLAGDPRGAPLSLGSTLPNRSSLHLFHSLTATRFGYITNISWYGKCDGYLRLGIWDRDNEVNSSYTLMGKIELYSNSSKVGKRHDWTYNISSNSRLTVRPGSVLGVHFSTHDPPSTLACVEVQETKASQHNPTYYYSAAYGDQFRDPLHTVPLKDEKPFVPSNIAAIEGKSPTTFKIPQREGLLVAIVATVTCHCNTNCKLGVCDVRTGECILGCVPGYSGEMCDNTCPQGYYGENCTQICSDFCQSQTCHPITGFCENCISQTYGLQFGCTEQCAQCKRNTECSPENGECLDGCKEGFLPPRCLECTPGFWGETCNKSCGNCFDNSTCSPLDGQCLLGCENGYQPPLCSEPCKSGYFGFQCAIRCGACRSALNCDPITGECPEKKCRMGYQSPQCQMPGTDNGVSGDKLFCPVKDDIFFAYRSKACGRTGFPTILLLCIIVNSISLLN